MRRIWMIALLAFSAGLIAGAVIVWQHGGPQPASNTLRPASNSVDAAKPKSSAVRAPNAAIGVRPAARLLSDETEVDFGVLPEGELVEHTFVLKNVSGAPLKIVGVRASCSCAIADVETDALAPGQSTELYATIDLADFVGEFHRTIIVEIDDRTAPSLELAVFGTVEPDSASRD